MANVIVQPIKLSDVLENKDDYNVNNIETSGITPEIYKEWVGKFSFEKWYSGLLEAKLVEISEYDKEILMGLAKKVILANRVLTEDDLEDFSPSFLQLIGEALSTYDNRVFVKTSEKSGKNDDMMRPSTTVLEVIKSVTNSKDIFLYSMTREDQCRYLIIQPWSDLISSMNEFRVIIEDRRILAISQQQLYKYVGLNEELCRRAAESIQSWYEVNKEVIPYEAVVLDMYVDFNSGSQSHNAHLIECNPGYAWGSSGSSLFHWVRDRDLFDTESVIVRYIMDDNT